MTHALTYVLAAAGCTSLQTIAYHGLICMSPGEHFSHARNLHMQRRTDSDVCLLSITQGPIQCLECMCLL